MNCSNSKCKYYASNNGKPITADKNEKEPSVMAKFFGINKHTGGCKFPYCKLNSHK